jgi:hypothetical protein
LCGEGDNSAADDHRRGVDNRDGDRRPKVPAVHEWLGLRFISKSWFNLDVVWAQSLIFVGAIGVTSAAASGALSAIN